VATSAKRLGMDVKDDLELELRLRRIEAELEQCVKASDIGDGSDQTQRVSTVPQVTGLRVTGRTAGAISMAWNQVRISDLRRYELWIAEDLAFSTNLQTFNVAGTDYTYSTVSSTGGGGNTSVYAKVRARTKSGNVGVFSAILNALTGQAQTDDIADESVTVEKVSTEDPDSTVWTSENDGAGSGLDADLVDGIDSDELMTVDGYHAEDLLVFDEVVPLYYESASTAMADNSDITFNHGLGSEPRLVQVYAVCISAELGHSVGDKLLIGWGSEGTVGGGKGVECFIRGTTSIIIRIAQNGIRMLSTAPIVWTNATTAKWELIVKAWK